MKKYYVYIMSNKKNGTMYIGVTNNLERRVFEHKNHLVDGFTNKYDLNKLVWFAETNTAESAVLKEKQMKKWNRAWKIKLIEGNNPEWKDLSEEWYGFPPARE